jgi:hypothetical protein
LRESKTSLRGNSRLYELPMALLFRNNLIFSGF